MPFVTFIARGQFVAPFLLAGPSVVGRSLDCDVYIPDIFVSRQHCRFQPCPEGWEVVDVGSRNGIYVRGRRVERHILQHDDILELGSVALMYDEGDLLPQLSNPAPFGSGAPVAELMDTLFAAGVRPAEFARQNVRRPLWSLPDGEVPEEEVPAVAEIDVQIEEPDEWTELDIEVQVLAAAPMTPLMILAPADAAAAAAAYAATNGEEGETATLVAHRSAQRNLDSADIAVSTSAAVGASGGWLPASTGNAAATMAPGTEPAGMASGRFRKNLWDEAALKPPPDASQGKKRETRASKAAEKPMTTTAAGVKIETGGGPTLMERLAELRQINLQDLMSDTVDWLRQRPAIAITGAVIVVLALGWYVNYSLHPHYRRLPNTSLTASD